MKSRERGSNVAGMKIGNTIYLDHQATTPVSPRVLQRMLPYYSEHFGNPHSSEHILGWNAARAVESAKVKVGSLIGADPDEIFFTSGATEANNLALLGLVRKIPNINRRKILISCIEHKSIIELGSIIRDYHGYDLVIIPVDNDGIIDVEMYEKLLDDNVLLVSVMAVNNEIGSIQPIAEIGKLANKYGAYFHCDAAQAPCAIAIDVNSMDIDMLSLSGHKVYGPKGIGALYINRSVQHKIEPIIYGGGQQDNLRSGTIPVPLCVGFSEACELLKLPEALEERNLLASRRDLFVSKLTSVCKNVVLNGPISLKRHPGNANLRFVGFSAHEILLTMQPHVAASSGSACTSGIPEPSYVLRSIGLSEEEASASIRFSLGRYTTEEDIETSVGIIRNALLSLQSGTSI